jgi:hypothetical protein
MASARERGLGIDFLFGMLTYPLTLLLWLALLLGCSFCAYDRHKDAMPVRPVRLFCGYLCAVAACVVCAAADAYVTPQEAAQVWHVPPDKYWTAMLQEFLFAVAPVTIFSTAGIALVGVPVILRLARAGRGSIAWVLLASLAISLLGVALLGGAIFSMGGHTRGVLRAVLPIAGAHLLMALCFCLGAGLPWSVQYKSVP